MTNSPWPAFILAAQRAGFTVEESEEHGGWIVTTPKRPRRPPEVHAAGWKTAEQAWRGAASICHTGNY